MSSSSQIHGDSFYASATLYGGIISNNLDSKFKIFIKCSRGAIDGCITLRISMILMRKQLTVRLPCTLSSITGDETGLNSVTIDPRSHCEYDALRMFSTSNEHSQSHLVRHSCMLDF